MQSTLIKNRLDYIKAARVLGLPNMGGEQYEEADRALREVDNAPIGWVLAKDLISNLPVNETENQAVLLCIAKLLRNKVGCFFSELGQSDYIPLFDMILNCLSIKPVLNKPVRSNLEECLVITYMRIYPAKPDIVEFLLNKFGKDIELRVIFFETLELIPGLIYDEKIVIEDEIREGFYTFLRAKMQATVLEVTHRAAMEMKSEKDTYRLIKCFSEWLIEKSSEDIKVNLVQHNLLDLSFKCLNNEIICEEAATALEDVLCLCLDPANYEALYQKFTDKLTESIPICNARIIQENDEEDVILESHMRIYTRYLVRMIFFLFKTDSNKPLINILKAILNIYSNPQMKISGKTAVHINKLLKKLRKYQSNSTNKPHFAQLCNQFLKQNIPLFQDFILASIKVVRLSREHFIYYEKNNYDSDADLDREFENKIYDRDDTKILLRHIASLYGFTFVIQKIAGNMKLCIDQLKQTPGNVELWVDFEAYLYCLRACIKDVNKNEDNAKIIQELMRLVINMNIPYIMVLHTGLEIISRCTAFYGNQEALLQQTFKFLSACMTKVSLQENAAKAITYLCENNSRFVIQRLPEFMEFYKKMCDKEGVIKGMVIAINELPENQEKADIITQICRPFAGKLLEIAKAPSLEDKKLQRTIDLAAIVYLEKMSIIMKTLKSAPPNKDQPHAMVPIVRQMWPLIEKLLTKYATNYDVIEKLCRLLKFTMRCINHHFAEFLDPYFKIVIRNYEIKPLPTYLYTVENALTVFYNKEDKHEWLTKILQHMCNRTYKELLDIYAFQKNGDLVDDFFGLLTRYLRFRPEILLTFENLEKQLQMCIIGIGFNQTSAAKAIYQFIEEIFRCCGPKFQKNQRLLDLIINKRYGEAIIVKIIEAFITEYPHSKQVVEYKYDVIYEAIDNLHPHCGQWFQNAFAKVPVDVLNEGEKKSFCQNLQAKQIKEHTDYYHDFFHKFFRRCKAHDMRT